MNDDHSLYDSRKVHQDIQQASNGWARHTELNFREVTEGEKADFNLAFVSDDHGNGYLLNGTLSHAFYPWTSNNRGQIHFNRNTQWSNT